VPATNPDAAMDRYAAGDDAAFTDVYDAVAPRLFSYLRRNVAEPTLAEDLLQKTMLQMHRARGTFIGGSAVMPWAFAIARRLLIDEIRKDRRNVLANAERDREDAECGASDLPEAVLEAHDLARRLQAELVRLPETQRVAFELMRMDGLSHGEAAEALGVTVSAVKLRAHRAYVALRAVLGETVVDPTDG